MDPVKIAIYEQINIKCAECKDLSFCKLPYYYHQLDDPSIMDLHYLKNCLFFKKEEKPMQQIIYSQSWI